MKTSSRGGDERPRRGPAVLAAAAGLTVALIAHGQVLRVPGRPAAPALAEPTYAGSVLETLEGEIVQLARETRGAAEDRRILLLAAVNWRIIAAESLKHGQDHGEHGSINVLLGLRLAHGRQTIDGLLAAVQTDPAAGSGALDEVDRFNDAAIDLAPLIRTTDADRLDDAIARIIAPLGRGLAPLLDEPAVSHWPVATAGGAAPAADGPSSLDEIAARLAAAPFRADTRAVIDEIVGFLRRGWRFEDLRPKVLASVDQIVSAARIAGVLAGAEWLGEETRAAYEDRLHRVVSMHRDPDLRGQGAAALARLLASSSIIERLTVLEVRQADRRSLVRALLTIEEAEAPADLSTLAGIVDRMIAFRRLPRVELPRDLRAAAGKLRHAYEAAERTLLREIETVVRDRAAMTDPAASTLVVGHARRLEDLLRVRRLPAFARTFAKIDPEGSVAFGRHLRRMSQGLLDPDRRPDAAEELDALEEEIGLFRELPFEAELARPAPAAIVATGGMHDELLRLVEASRREWAAGWTRSGVGRDVQREAADRMRALVRLLRNMAGSEELLGLEAGPPVLDRWAAWEMSREVLARILADLPNRLKLATAAVVEGSEETLRAQLDRIEREAPLARLLARLSIALGPELSPLPDGASGLLGQLVHPPPTTARLIERRRDVADLCRYAMEAEHAWTQGRDAEAGTVQAFVNALAGELLEVIDEGGARSSSGEDG